MHRCSSFARHTLDASAVFTRYVMVFQRLMFDAWYSNSIVNHVDRCSASTVYPKRYAHGFCFAVLCCGYTLTDFPIPIRLTSLALWQSDDCPSASKATLMNMDKYFIWIHYERLHNHNKAKHNKTVCIFLGIYCRHITAACVPHWTWNLLFEVIVNITLNRVLRHSKGNSNGDFCLASNYICCNEALLLGTIHMSHSFMWVFLSGNALPCKCRQYDVQYITKICTQLASRFDLSLLMSFTTNASAAGYFMIVYFLSGVGQCNGSKIVRFFCLWCVEFHERWNYSKETSITFGSYIKEHRSVWKGSAVAKMHLGPTQHFSIMFSSYARDHAIQII